MISKKYKIAVVGSRSVKNPNIVFDYLDTKKDKISMIISGGCNGPDSYSYEWCKLRGFPILIYFPKWRDDKGIYYKGAGFLRNIQIVKDADIVISFYDGISKGTAHSMELAKKYDKKLIVVSCPIPEDNIEKEEDVPEDIPFD